MSRRSVAGFLFAFIAALAAAAPAGAATVSLGKIAPPGVPGGCSGCSFFQKQTDPASPSYVVPPGGPWTVTQWSARGGTIDDAARLLVFRQTGVANQFRLIANSLDRPYPGAEAPVNRTDIPVQPGDGIGLRTQGFGNMPTHHDSTFLADQFAGIAGSLTLGETVGPGGDHSYGVNPAGFINVSATLTSPEPAKKKCKKKRRKKARAAGTGKRKKCKKKRKK